MGEIRSAEEWKRELTRHKRTLSKEKLQHARREERERLCADLRDDTISLIRNSGFSFEEIREKGGPVVKTLQGWQDKTTFSPHTSSMRRALRVIGKDIGIIDYLPKKAKKLGIQGTPSGE